MYNSYIGIYTIDFQFFLEFIFKHKTNFAACRFCFFNFILMFINALRFENSAVYIRL